MPTGSPAKSSWLLITLAVLSFVPGLGIFFAAAALSWALVSDRPRARLAGRLAVAGAVANLVGGAVIVRWAQKRPEFRQVQDESTRRDLRVLVDELERYHARNGSYPPTLQQLVGYPIPVKLINIYDSNGGLSMIMVPFQYHVATNGASYDLYSTGPDRVPDTDDDIRPVLSDSARQHSGYRPAR